MKFSYRNLLWGYIFFSIINPLSACPHRGEEHIDNRELQVSLSAVAVPLPTICQSPITDNKLIPYLKFKNIAIKFCRDEDHAKHVMLFIGEQRPTPWRLPREDENELTEIMAAHYLRLEEKVLANPKTGWKSCKPIIDTALKLVFTYPLRDKAEEDYGQEWATEIQKFFPKTSPQYPILLADKNLQESFIRRGKIQTRIKYFQDFHQQFSKHHPEFQGQDYDDLINSYLNLNPDAPTVSYSSKNKFNDYCPMIHHYLRETISTFNIELTASKSFFRKQICDIK